MQDVSQGLHVGLQDFSWNLPYCCTSRHQRVLVLDA
jgi:hypothetical protein